MLPLPEGKDMCMKIKSKFGSGYLLRSLKRKKKVYTKWLKKIIIIN